MSRPKKEPDEVLMAATAMLPPTFVEELDKVSRQLRQSRSQFLAMLIERGYAAWRRDGLLFEPRNEIEITGIKKKSTK
jgi:hypothetical protein